MPSLLSEGVLDTTLHKKDYIAYIYNTDALIQVGNVSFLQPSSQMRNFKLQEKQCVLIIITFLGTMFLSQMQVPRIYIYPDQHIENTVIPISTSLCTGLYVFHLMYWLGNMHSGNMHLG